MVGCWPEMIVPRHARLDFAGKPQLVLQQSAHDRPMFLDEDDYRYYRAELQAASIQYGCSVHAYALLPQSVYFLVTGSGRGNVPRMMQSLGRRFAHYANQRDGTHGARWLGRYHSCPVGGDAHVLRASVFVELAPVRAGAATHAQAYPWSSAACNAQGSVDPCITPSSAYLALSVQSRARRSRYRALLMGTPPEDGELLLHIKQGRAWGSVGFLRKMATVLGESVRARPRGRPRKFSRSAKLAQFCTTLSPFLLTGWMSLQQTLDASV